MINSNRVQFPPGLNLHILLEELPSALALDAEQLELLRAFIVKYSSERRKQRIIVLPSDKCLKKIISHFYLKSVSEGKLAKKSALAILEELGISQKQGMRFFVQRNKELLREKD